MEKGKVLGLLSKLYFEMKGRVESDALYNYNRVVRHEKQIAFHKCRKRNRWVFGGNRTGKTECGAVEVVYFARGCHPYRENRRDTFGWVVSLSRQVQRDVAQKKVLKYLKPEWIVSVVMQQGKKDYPDSGVIDYIEIKNVFGGISKIGFKSCDQGREKFQGASLDYVWFDEEPSEEVYRECKMRVLDKRGDIFGTMTPLKGMSFVYDEIYLNCNQSSEIWYETMSWEDNPFLSREEIKLFSDTMSEEELEARKYGRFICSSGLVYKEFDENVNVIDPFDVPKEWFDNISIDPGLNNPLSCHWYAVDYDGNVYVIYEHFEAGKDIDYHADKIKQICEFLGWKRDSLGKISALIDSAAGQTTLNGVKSVAELFIDRGINVNTKVNKDVFAGIATVKSYLKSANGASRLFIFRNCPNLIREIKSYRWGEGDLPTKKDDHALDELRYYLMTKPLAHKREKNRLELYKESVIRKVKGRKKGLF